MKSLTYEFSYNNKNGFITVHNMSAKFEPFFFWRTVYIRVHWVVRDFTFKMQIKMFLGKV